MNFIYHFCDNLKIQYYTFHNAVSEKQFFAITNLAHLFLQKGRQKPNKLNYQPHNKKVCFALFAHLPLVSQYARACGSMV
jgi:hypothetical protein